MVSRTSNRRRVDVARPPVSLARVASIVMRTLGALGVCGLVAFVAIYGRGYLREAEWLSLSTVTFNGVTRSTGAELSQHAGLTVGMLLVDVDTDAVERAMSSQPWVKSVVATRVFPHTLTIDVKERVPAAVLSLGDLYIVDTEGQPVKRLEQSDGLDLPIISGIDREGFEAHREETAVAVRGALEAIRAWTERSGLAELSELEVTEGGYAYLTSDGARVQLTNVDIAGSLDRLERVQHALRTRQLTAQVIRLDSRLDRVTVQLSSTSAVGPLSVR